MITDEKPAAIPERKKVIPADALVTETELRHQILDRSFSSRSPRKIYFYG